MASFQDLQDDVENDASSEHAESVLESVLETVLENDETVLETFAQRPSVTPAAFEEDAQASSRQAASPSTENCCFLGLKTMFGLAPALVKRDDLAAPLEEVAVQQAPEASFLGPKEVVIRPPLWKRLTNPPTLKLDEDRLACLKQKQGQTLASFRECCETNSWGQLHKAHFDWWQFPIDDGSKSQYNVTSEDDIDILRSDAEWLARYRESVNLAVAAWGWDLAASEPFESPVPGMGWTKGKDVRLAKICRSLYLFEQDELLQSVQAFARHIQHVHKNGASFEDKYHGINFDELLHFQLPR